MVIGATISEQMPNATEICKKKARLMEQYAEAAHLFSRAVERLLRDGHSSSSFNSGREAVKRAQEKCKLACVALEKHFTTHNC
jgi:hypothetical protein